MKEGLRSKRFKKYFSQLSKFLQTALLTRTDFSMCLIMSKGSIYIRNQKICNGFLTIHNTISSICLDTNDSLPIHLSPGSTKAWNLNGLSLDSRGPETTQVNTHYHSSSLHKLHIPESPKPPVLVSIATTVAPPSLDAASSSSMIHWLVKCPRCTKQTCMWSFLTTVPTLHLGLKCYSEFSST